MESTVIAGGEKLHVLCLHGYRQSGPSFKAKVGSFRKICGKLAQFTFITAPHRVVPAAATAAGEEKASDEEDEFGWWLDNTTPANSSQRGFQESVEAISAAAARDGPFHGILAFSQGAAFAAQLAAMQEEGAIQPGGVRFEFCILVAGFVSRSSGPHHQARLSALRQPISVKSLHVMGTTDKVIPRERSEELLAYFERPEVLVHEGGHYVPTGGDAKLAYRSFLARARDSL